MKDIVKRSEDGQCVLTISRSQRSVLSLMTLSVYGRAEYGIGHRTSGGGPGHKDGPLGSWSFAESMTGLYNMIEEIGRLSSRPGRKVLVFMKIVDEKRPSRRTR